MLKLSKLALGTVQFGSNYGINNYDGKPSTNEIDYILSMAHVNNIELLDTANAYGEAEQVIGQLNKKRFDIVTKFLPESQNGLFENQFRDSLHKLETENVYGLLAHRPLDVVENPEIWEKMSIQKNNKKVKKIGFSFDKPEEYYAVIEKSFFPDIVQVPLNYFDDRFAGIIQELKSKGCEIHVRSVFLQGLFFTNPTQLPSFFNEVKMLIDELQKEHGPFLAAALLQFILNNKFVDKVVIGVQNRFQLQNIFDSLEDASDLSKLDNKINHEILQPSLWPK